MVRAERGEVVMFAAPGAKILASAIFNEAVQMELVERNPFIGVREPHTQRRATER